MTVCPTAEWQTNATTVAGSPSRVAGSNPSMLNLPCDLYVTNDSTIYVLDSGNYRVQRFFSNLTEGTTVINGSAGAELNQFRSSKYILSRSISSFYLRFILVVAINLDPNGSIYILDAGNNRVVKWTSDGTSGTIVAGGNGQGNNSDQLYTPFGMYVDSSTSFIWIADTGNSRIVRWGSSSPAMIVCGSNGQGADQFYHPQGLFVDTSSSNTLYVADTDNHRIQMWLPEATTGSTPAGKTGDYGSGLNQLWNPRALLVDTNGYMYIVDSGNDRIMRWMVGATSGVIIAGSGTSETSPNQSIYPYNIKFDLGGDLLVADTYNNRIQKFSVSCGKFQKCNYFIKIKVVTKVF